MTRLYDSVRWRRYRLSYLREHPLCVMCERRGKITPATVVDHKKPHDGDPVLFWDPDNHQPLCDTCHGIKRRQDHGKLLPGCGVDGVPLDPAHPWNHEVKA